MKQVCQLLVILFFPFFLFGQSAESYLKKANELLNEQDYIGAMTEYDNCIELDDKNVHAYVNRGVCKKLLNLNYVALEDFSKAIELNEDELVAYVNRIPINLKLKNYHEVISDCNKVISLDPEFGRMFAFRAEAKHLLGDYRGALVDFDIALGMDFINSDVLGKKAYCLIELNNLSEAIRCYDKIIYLDPNNSDAYLNRGSAKLMTEDVNGACQDWSKSGELGKKRAYELIREYCK